MAMAPAEPSRPGRKWSGSALLVEGPFWAAIVIIVFVIGLIMLADFSLEVSRMLSSGNHSPASDIAMPLVGCVVGIVIVITLLTAYARHSRTRSDAATVLFRAMSVLMLIAGVILFLGGATQLIETEGFSEQLTIGMVSVIYVATPLSLHLIAK